MIVQKSKETYTAKELFGDNAVWFGCAKIVKEKEEYVKEVLINAGNQKRNA